MAVNQPPAPAGPSTAERVVAAILTVLLITAAMFLGFTTLFAFSMSTDGCYERCREEFVGHAFTAQWVAIGLSVLVTVAGLVYAAAKNKVMIIWPLLGFVVLGAGTWIAFRFIDVAMGH